MTYREVLAVQEFRALFLSQLLSLVGDQVARIAMALLVYQRSGSAFGASATYACSYLTWLVGGPVLSALADRRCRRNIMVFADIARGLLVAILLVPEPPLWAVFAVLAAIGVLAPPFESARSAILPDILTGDAYVSANTLVNTTLQGAQVTGFLFGGILVALVSVRGALAIDVATFAVSAIVVRRWVVARPPTSGPSRLLADVADGFRLVRDDRFLRDLLLYAVIATAVAIVPEGLAVAVAADQGRHAVAAGVLTASLPLGYVLASTLLLHIPAENRPAWLLRLTLVLCIPLLLTPLAPNVAVTTMLWVTAGLGTSVQLIASVAFVAACPAHMRGRTFGIASSALMLTQGATLLVAGAVADTVGSRNVVAAAGAGGLIVLLALRGRLPRAKANVQESTGKRRPTHG